MMPTLELKLLGSPQINIDGAPVNDFVTRKAEALLIYLAVNQRVYTRDTLAGLFWPEVAETQAKNSLRRILSNLRQLVSPYLQIDRQTIAFDQQAAHWLDVEIFTTTLAPFAQTTTPAQVDYVQLAQALALYQDEFLAGFYLPDAPAFEEWTLFQREHLRTMAIRGLTRLADLYLVQGEYATGLATTQRLLAVEPWCETAYLQQMMLLAQMGQRTAALAQYEQCRTLLATEFGTQPLPALTALYDQLKTGEDIPAFQGALGKNNGEPNRLTVVHPQSGTGSAPLVPGVSAPLKVDWGEIPRIGAFYGREAELRQLTQWLLAEQCALVGIVGVGGVGKTTLAAQWVHLLTQEAATAPPAPFTRIIWRSLRNAPPLDAILRMWLQLFADQQLSALPATVDEQLVLLFHYLRQERCLLVLDNWESILPIGDATGGYLSGYENYGLLLQRISELHHQSCLLLTSRETNLEMARLERERPVVRMLPLQGMSVAVGAEILRAAGLKTHQRDLATLVQRYSGNPLALKLVAETVLDYYQGNSTAFLQQEALVFDDIRQVLAQQVRRVSPFEREILLWLTIEREPVAVHSLLHNFVQPPSHGALLIALRALHRRSLLEQVLFQQKGEYSRAEVRFGLQNVVLEYLTDLLRETMEAELASEVLVNFLRFALVKAQAMDYIREAQLRFILHPLAQHLRITCGPSGVVRKLKQLLVKLRADFVGAPGYGAANLLHLAFHLEVPLTGWDFSQLAIRQADLRNRRLPAVSFAQANFAETAFMEKFQAMLAVAFSPNGAVVAAGGASGDVHLWRAQDGQLLAVCSGHGRWIWAVAFSPDGRTLAGGAAGGAITLWDVAALTEEATNEETVNIVSEQPRQITLTGHTDAVFGLAFSPDGRYLASASADHTVNLWDMVRKKRHKTLRGHTAPVYTVAYDPSGLFLASAGRDQMIRLWDLATVQCCQILTHHQALITHLRFCTDGAWLLSSSIDHTVHLWQVQRQAKADLPLLQLHRSLQDEPTEIVALALSADGKTIATNGPDASIRLWESATGLLMRTLTGHSETVQALAFSPNGQTLVSGAWDQSVRFWNIATGYALYTLQGYTNEVTALALSPNGEHLLNANTDATLYRWHLPTRQLRHVQDTRRVAILALAFHPQGGMVATGDADHLIRLWTLRNENLTFSQQWRGHDDAVATLAFHPAGTLLASGSKDCTVHLWDYATGGYSQLAPVHKRAVQAVVFSPNGQWLVSGDDDGQVVLWQPAQGEKPAGAVTIDGWTPRLLGSVPGGVTTLAFSPDGALLAGAGPDHTIFLWQMVEQTLLATLPTPVHSTIYALAFNPTAPGNHLELVSSSGNGAICYWDIDQDQGEQRLRYMVKEHQRSVRAILFTPDGATLISGSADETIKLWDAKTGACCATLPLEQPYQGMKITGATGLTPAQQSVLKTLGASNI
ncbi:MAG: BTAD domain-containing putative transcriptional regulator [Caldilineaceae bacterium]